MIHFLTDSEQCKALFWGADHDVDTKFGQSALLNFKLFDKKPNSGISERRDYGPKQQSDNKGGKVIGRFLFLSVFEIC